LSNLGDHIDNTTVRNILRRNHIDPAPIRGRAGMSWSQFLKLHLEVLQATGVFEDLRSTLSDTWTVVLQRVQKLGAPFVLLPRIVRHGAMSVLVFVAQQGHALWAEFLVALTPRYAGDVGRRGRVSDDAMRLPHLVLLQSVDQALQSSPIMQGRSPPGSRQLTLTPIGVHLTRGRGASNFRLVSVSIGEYESGRVSDHSQQTTALTALDGS
jgi:hypothetical protein